MTIQTSKNRFAAGLQCHKLLWWSAHEPEAPELVPDPASRVLMKEEQRVVERARAFFPDGFLIDAPGSQVQERVNATRRALDRGVPAIFQATFARDGVVVSVDILAREGRGHALIEVKSSVTVTPHDLWDAALQAYVLRRIGVDVDSVEIMHLNEACRFPDLKDLFVRESVSGRVRGLYPQISELLTQQEEMLEGPIPEVPVGKHCDEPRSCPFKERCWPSLPKHHVGTFHGLRQEASAQLDSQGHSLVEEVPASFPLTVIQRRQHSSVTSGEVQVEESLAGAIAPLQGRVAYLNFETVSVPIPMWEGMGPWHHHPVQFSCHISSPDSGLEHHEWLAEGPEDSRNTMADALLEVLEGVDEVVVYDKRFVKSCLGSIAAGAPDRARRLQAISTKLRDLSTIVRDHVYHPDFLGSFTLEAVLPALVPEFSHESLGVPEGHTPSVLLRRLLLPGEPQDPGERKDLRESLLGSCAARTQSLVRLKERLDELATVEA